MKPYEDNLEMQNDELKAINAELLEAAKRGLDWMRNEGIGLDDQKRIEQVIAKAEEA